MKCIRGSGSSGAKSYSKVTLKSLCGLSSMLDMKAKLIANARTILLVDDSEIVRKRLGQILEEEGYNVLQAADGMQGVESAIQHEPDLIITDIDMPVMNGVEAIRSIRLQLGFSIPIIAISAHPAEYMKTLALKNGFTAYLSKPFNLDQLRNLLSELVHQQS
jgi:CheY-like chemotaxis protein